MLDKTVQLLSIVSKPTAYANHTWNIYLNDQKVLSFLKRSSNVEGPVVDIDKGDYYRLDGKSRYSFYRRKTIVTNVNEDIRLCSKRIFKVL